MKKIILDTDVGGDCDDMGALAILHRAFRKGLIDWKAITISTGNPFSAACADAVNKYYNVEIPIGQIGRSVPGDLGVDFDLFYGKYIAEKFDNSFYPNGKKPQDAVRLFRRVLSKNKGEKVTVVMIGFSSNIADLLLSKNDDISPMSGSEILAASVDEIIMMGCNFYGEDDFESECGEETVHAEWNIKCDIPSAQMLFNNSPVPITICPFSVGYQLMSGAKIISSEPDNPVSAAYEVHSHGDRDSWDPATVYYAVFKDEECFAVSDRGTVQINSQGVSKFVKGHGNHRILFCKDRSGLKEKLDKAMQGIFA